MRQMPIILAVLVLLTKGTPPVHAEQPPTADPPATDTGFQPVRYGQDAHATAQPDAAGPGVQTEPAEGPRRGPLADLPSPATAPHLAKIKALGDSEWLDLGSPAPDPKWGKAPGRSWAPRMPYAPDLRGAFLFGEGPHGRIKPDGHYMDDLWFYDINRHRWICVYPGMKAEDGYERIRINEEGLEVGPDGHYVAIAQVGHAYAAVTYDLHRNLFLSAPTFQHYWRKAIKGRKEALDAAKDKLADPQHLGPVIYNTAEGHWDRHTTRNQRAGQGSGCTLLYVPSVRKAFGYTNKRSHIAWYDPAAREWSEIKPKGELPPWGMDINSCYDSRRDRIYLGGGIYPSVEAGQSALWMFDVKTETFSRLQPTGAPTSTNYATNRARMQYDSVNDVVLLFQHRVSDGEIPGIYAYHPGPNEWKTVAQWPAAFSGFPHPNWNGFYDPQLNAHFQHVAGDGVANGTMWVYRYKRAMEEERQ